MSQAFSLELSFGDTQLDWREVGQYFSALYMHNVLNSEHIVLQGEQDAYAWSQNSQAVDPMPHEYDYQLWLDSPVQPMIPTPGIPSYMKICGKFPCIPYWPLFTSSAPSHLYLGDSSHLTCFAKSSLDTSKGQISECSPSMLWCIPWLSALISKNHHKPETFRHRKYSCMLKTILNPERNTHTCESKKKLAYGLHD